MVRVANRADFNTAWVILGDRFQAVRAAVLLRADKLDRFITSKDQGGTAGADLCVFLETAVSVSAAE
jgi:hypothetical protein